MRLPRFRLRTQMALVALVAALVAGVPRLMVGDGGVVVEFVNGTGRPMRHVRLACQGQPLVAADLAPGTRTRGRFWPVGVRPGGTLDAGFLLSFTVNTPCELRPQHRFPLLESEPNVRWTIQDVDAQGQPTLHISGTDDPPITRWRRRLRRFWFLGADLALGSVLRARRTWAPTRRPEPKTRLYDAHGGRGPWPWLSPADDRPGSSPLMSSDHALMIRGSVPRAPVRGGPNRGRSRKGPPREPAEIAEEKPLKYKRDPSILF